MQRALPALADEEHDIVVIGGGITGSCIAWDAASRGLKVALLEQEDFAHAASGNCFKMVHGGIRYLQHLDTWRIRQSSRERNAFMRIAPHLVHSLPIVIPTYGHGLKGRELLRVGGLIYDLLTLDRNHGVTDPRQRLPFVRSVSRETCLTLFPGLHAEGLTSGLLFHDGQMHSPARLALAFLKSADAHGAQAANYVRVTGFVRQGRRLRSVRVLDRLSGVECEVPGRLFVDASGGWTTGLLANGAGVRLPTPPTFSRDAAFVTSRPLTGAYGLAILGSTRDPDAVLSRGRRHLFIAPWQRGSLVGVWHAVRNQPDDTRLSEPELLAFLAEVNAAHPGLLLTLDDVSACLTGMTLSGENQAGAGDLSYGKRSVVLDHGPEHGADNLLSVISVRYTIARRVAEQAVDLVFHKLGRQGPRSQTAVTPIYGGAIDDIDRLRSDAESRYGTVFGTGVVRDLVRNHGTAYTEVVERTREDASLNDALGTSNTLKAEVVHAVRSEMARKLGDVVLRRTDLGTAGHPGNAALVECAAVMARELRWDASRVARELDEVRAAFPGFVAAPPTRSNAVQLEMVGGG